MRPLTNQVTRVATLLNSSERTITVKPKIHTPLVKANRTIVNSALINVNIMFLLSRESIYNLKMYTSFSLAPHPPRGGWGGGGRSSPKTTCCAGTPLLEPRPGWSTAALPQLLARCSSDEQQRPSHASQRT